MHIDVVLIPWPSTYPSCYSNNLQWARFEVILGSSTTLCGMLVRLGSPPACCKRVHVIYHDQICAHVAVACSSLPMMPWLLSIVKC